MARKQWRETAGPMPDDPVMRAEMARVHRAMDVVRDMAQLREERGRTQGEVAATPGLSQPTVSRLRHEEDSVLATLREYIGALGGRLEVRAVFPDEHTIHLTPRDTALTSEPVPASEE
jgi:hypothetical protein